MLVAFAILAVVMIVSAAVAMALRNLIHSALCLVITWMSVAGFYLWAGAEFLAFAQVVVYVGAISMVVLFAVLLTRRTMGEVVEAERLTMSRTINGFFAAGAVAGLLVAAVMMSHLGQVENQPMVKVRAIGEELAGRHVASLLVAGVILTAALLGAVVIAASERQRGGKGPT